MRSDGRSAIICCKALLKWRRQNTHDLTTRRTTEPPWITQNLSRNLESTWSFPPWPVFSCISFTRREDTGESEERIRGNFISSDTGALWMRPPTRNNPSLRMGLRGVRRLLFGKQPFSVDKSVISLGKESIWLQRTTTNSAYLRSVAQRGMLRGSKPEELHAEEWRRPFNARRIKATNLQSLYQSEK